MSRITQLIPSNHIYNSNLETRITIKSNDNNITDIELLNDFNKKKWNFQVFKNNNENMFILPKHFEPGNYLVFCSFENENVCNKFNYTCYPSLLATNKTQVSIFGEKVIINGTGFTSGTKITTYYGDEEKDTKYELINENEIICILEKYNGISENVAIKCATNGIDSMSMLYLKYDKPIIANISSENIPLQTDFELNIYGKNLGKSIESIENIEIHIGKFIVDKQHIVSCSETEIKCKIKYDFEIGIEKMYIKACGMKSNEFSVKIIPCLISLSENIIEIENKNSEIILKGNGFNHSSKVFFNNVHQPCCEIISENEILINIDEIKSPQEIRISVETNGYKSFQNLLLTIIDHGVSKLSVNAGVVNEKTNIIIYGFGFEKKSTVVIEKDNEIIDKIETNAYDNIIEFIFPKPTWIGCFLIYVIKNNIPSKKHEYAQMPKYAICHPSTFPIALSKPEFVNGYIEFDGIININDVKFEIMCEEYDFFIQPKLTKISKENKSVFSFKMKELNNINQIHTTLKLFKTDIEINNIAFIPKITDIKPIMLNVEEVSEIEINGFGFSKNTEVYINENKINFYINDKFTFIKTDTFTPNCIGPVVLKIKMNEICEIIEYLFVKPIIEKIEFPTEIKSNENPYFYLKCKEFPENIDIIAKINNILCSCLVESNQIRISTEKYDNEIKNAQLSVSFLFNNMINNFYINDSFTYPQMIYTEKNYGLCTKNNSVIIKGYGIDSNTKIKVNGNITNGRFASDSYIISIPQTNTCQQYEIISINNENVNSINKIIYFTIPEIIELSQTMGGAKGDNTITIRGIGFTKNVHAIWFDETKVIGNIEKEDTITCIVPCSQNSISKKINIRIETNENHMSNALEYQYIPEISGLSSDSGYSIGGYKLTLYGYGFIECETIEFGDDKIYNFIEHTNTAITFSVPQFAVHETVNIRVIFNNIIKSNIVQFTYILPKITHIEPCGGYVRGGEKITIYGEGLSKDVALYSDNKLIDTAIIDNNNISYISPESFVKEDIYVHIQSHNKKLKKILKYSYNAQKISDIHPKSGSLKGGYEMTITGEGLFSDNVCVNIGNKIIQRSEFIKHTDEIIEFLVPANNIAGEVIVYVLVNNIKSENSMSFTYISKINSISVDSGYVNTKIPITIYGEGFTGMSTVKMGSNIISNHSFDSKTRAITFATPFFNIAQTIPITVTTNNCITNEIMFAIKPVINTINPNPWIAEDVGFLHVIGEGFSSDSLGCIMGVDKTEPKIIEPIKVSNNSLVFAMPYIKQCGEINLAIGTTAGNNDSWISKKIIIYPKITKLSENHGSINGGNTIEIIGKGFNKYSKIMIDEYLINDKMVEFINENSIMVNIPPSDVLKNIKIAVKCNELISNYVSYFYSPCIKDLKPNFSTLAGGSTSVITGEGINEKSIIIFNNKPISKENTIYDEKRKDITITIPEHFEVESVLIKVITNGIESCNNIKFYYTPIIENISITQSSVTNEDIITINGDGFCTNSLVKLGEKFIEPQSIMKITNECIHIKLPIIDQQSTQKIRVFTNSIPSSMTKTISFSAEFTKIVPSNGQVSGGTPVEIYGHGFNNEMIISFNEKIIDYTLISNEQISIITPKNSAVVGENRITMQCNKYMTNLSTIFICYPVLSYITQKYNSADKKMRIVLYGNGFSDHASVEIGNTIEHKPLFMNNTLTIEIDETYENKIINPMKVHVIVNGLKTTDEIYYSNIPCLNSCSTNMTNINGGDTISLYGNGFEKDNTYVFLEKLNMKIKPVYVSSNIIKFVSPKIDSVEKIHLTVISNNIKSSPLEFTYCPSIHSGSETTCNIGEEIKFKIYGEGYENSNTDVFVKNQGQCNLIRFINNKILEVKLPNNIKCGIAEIYVSVRGISSFDMLKLNIRPVILSFEQDYANVNDGCIEINGIGLNDVDTVIFIYRECRYELSNISIFENNMQKYNYEKIKVVYDTLKECKKIMKDENLEYIEFDVIVKNNNIESVPHKFIMKNIEYNINAENEAIKAITICNDYLSNNYVFFTYNFIKAYSEELIIIVRESIFKICELPDMYINAEAEKILFKGFIKICKNTEVSEVIIQYSIMRMVRTVIDILASGIIYETCSTSIYSPLTIFSNVFEQQYRKNGTEYDYLFNDCVEHVNDKLFNLLDAKELSKAISYRNMHDNDVEFYVNYEILNNICENFDAHFMQKKFILCNNNGCFNGSVVACPEGNIIDLLIYKITSSIIGYPQQHTHLLDTYEIKQNIINYMENSEEKSLGNQLKYTLTQNETLKTIYEQLMKNNPERFSRKNDNYTQIPFRRGDKIRISLYISSKINCANSPKSNIEADELLLKSCDPDIHNKGNPINYLLNNDATEIRPTRDCYEITLG
jgi:hypothetical protein